MVAEIEDGGLVDASRVSDILGVSKDSIYRWAREGRMGGAYRLNGLWRFNLEEVITWASSCLQRIRQPR